MCRPLLFLSLFLVAAPAGARSFGLGLALGDPTGINAKMMLGSNTAVDGTLGLSFLNGNNVSVHVDFLWEARLSQLSTGPLNGYLGLGGKLAVFDHDHGHGKKHDHHGDDDELWLGVRAPAGIDFIFKRVRLDLFIEIAAVLWLVEETDLDLDGALGVRYWF